MVVLDHYGFFSFTGYEINRNLYDFRRVSAFVETNPGSVDNRRTQWRFDGLNGHRV